MRKVTIVVPVLITSCQVSLQPKSGPLTSQASTTSNARPKVNGWPVARDVALVKRTNQRLRPVGRMAILLEVGGGPVSTPPASPT